MSEQTAFDLRWAGLHDEPDIRALVGSVPMPGAVSIRFAREPDYFMGATIMGDTCEVLIARHQADQRLAAMGCRAERKAYVNGAETTIGYIGQIRVAEGFRGAWLVQRGAQAYRERGAAEMLYFGVIARENPRARRLLAGSRLPAGVHVRRMCGLTTYAILLRKGHGSRVRGIEAIAASEADLPEIVGFLRDHGRQRQFFPAYRPEDFQDGTRMRNLAAEDIFMARRRGALVGVMAAWDQAPFKQDVVESYGASLRRARPLYDLAAPLMGYARLTPPGAAIPLAFAACVCVADNDINVMRGLLAACEQRASQRGKAFLMLGLADNDPLLVAARGSPHVTYHSDLYAACWFAEQLAALDDRLPYVEIAAL